jgi:hypothetical protein
MMTVEWDDWMVLGAAEQRALVARYRSIVRHEIWRNKASWGRLDAEQRRRD